MKFELTYKNRFGSVARLDIITFADTTVTEVIEGTEQPFTLKYSNEKGDKSGNFRTSGADINIYETANFNIDELKTSNETDIKVEYYIDEVLMWVGFVIPDFFSREIGVPAIVNMTASDRLNTLKGATLPSTSDTVTLRYLAEQCLAMTGLSLPLNTYADFTNVDNSDNIFDSKVTSQRVKDTKGRSISCYDVLQSILTLTNSILIQRKGEWYIINKTELETGTVVSGQAEVVFDDVSRGARRQIQPVASSVGVFNEHGGSRLYPYNYDFEQALTGWTAVGGFTATTNNKKVLGYSETNDYYTPIYGIDGDDRYLVNTNEWDASKYIQSDFVRIPYVKSGEVEVSFDINATVPAVAVTLYVPPAIIPFSVIARKNGVIYYLNESGLFDTTFKIHSLVGQSSHIHTADTLAKNVKGKIITDNMNDYEVAIRIYGSQLYATTLIRSAVFRYKLNAESPKGNIYKTEQGVNFTKQQDVDTSIFGDYITSGVNGYFYDYPIDDTSSLLTSTGVLTTRWTTVADADELPILQHVSRQKSRLFSVAHDLLRAQISIQKFDPLAIFKDCANKKYTLVSASVDFLNSSVDVEIEEIKTDTLISKRDFIYSYFGDKEDGIKSVGGISTGSGGGVGGGMTSGQLEILTNLASWWKYDETNNAIYSPLSVYSEGEVSAYGAGTEAVPTEGALYLKDLLDVQFATTVPTNDTIKFNGTKWVNVPFPTGVSSWNDLTDKPLTFAPTAHNHSASEIISGIFDIGRIPTGTTETTVALGNHVHSWSAITNKPSVFTPDTHVHQWNDIQNKPSVFTPDTHTHLWADLTDKPSTFAPSAHSHVKANITDFPASMPASDVYAWAKASTKPSYTASEIVGLGASYRWLTDAYIATWNAKEPAITKGTTSQYFRGDMSLALFPTALPASDVYSWAKASTKPSYVWSEIGSKPTTLSGYGITDAYTKSQVDSSLSGKVSKSGDTMTGNLTAPTFIGALQGNADTATKLATARTIAGTSFDGTANINISYNNLTNLPSLAFLPLAGGTMTGNLTMGATTDIITNFKTWTKDSSKSLKSFLDKFDIDTAGNLVVKTNLYSTGEVTAYSSGTGVSGLKLMADMNANGKAIYSVNYLQAGLSVQGGNAIIGSDPMNLFGTGMNVGLYNTDNDTVIAAYDDYNGMYYYANRSVTFSNYTNTLQAPAFKFGNWTFKQDASGRLGIYNGATEVACFNTDGTYVNI